MKPDAEWAVPRELLENGLGEGAFSGAELDEITASFMAKRLISPSRDGLSEGGRDGGSCGEVTVLAHAADTAGIVAVVRIVQGCCHEVIKSQRFGRGGPREHRRASLVEE